MKTLTLHRLGVEVHIEYDEAAPRTVCGEPVVSASMGGTTICPWCDCGNCRYCRQALGFRNPKEHVQSCHARKGKDVNEKKGEDL